LFRKEIGVEMIIKTVIRITTSLKKPAYLVHYYVTLNASGKCGIYTTQREKLEWVIREQTQYNSHLCVILLNGSAICLDFGIGACTQIPKTHNNIDS